MDGPNEVGELYERAGRLSDRFPSPFANDVAAQVANGGALPPDLSLMGKARAAHRGFPGFVFDIFTQYQESGPDYVYSLLTGYGEPPHGVTCSAALNYNSAFLAGNCIAMAQPLSDGQVEYTDGTPATLTNYSRDVSAFLMWAAEPHLEQRKSTGFKTMAFLIIFAGLLWFTKRKVWADVAH
jgi:ubiquinol-cytochrome c reductase cytochrome c1 subunit